MFNAADITNEVRETKSTMFLNIKETLKKYIF